MDSGLKKLIDDFFKQNPYEYATLSFVLGLLLSYKLNTAQINSLGNFLESIGQFMLTIAAQQSVKDESNENPNLNELINYLLNRFNSLDDAIGEILNYLDTI